MQPDGLPLSLFICTVSHNATTVNATALIDILAMNMY